MNILWVHEQYRTSIYLIHWTTNKEVCDSCSSASKTSNQALMSSSSWIWSRSSSVFFLLTFTFYLSNMTDWTRNRGLHPVFTIHRTKFWCKCDFTRLIYREHLVFLDGYLPTKSTKTCQVSTLVYKTPGYLVLHMDALLLKCKSENNQIWPERSS